MWISYIQDSNVSAYNCSTCKIIILKWGVIKIEMGSIDLIDYKKGTKYQNPYNQKNSNCSQ